MGTQEALRTCLATLNESKVALARAFYSGSGQPAQLVVTPATPPMTAQPAQPTQPTAQPTPTAMAKLPPPYHLFPGQRVQPGSGQQFAIGQPAAAAAAETQPVHPAQLQNSGSTRAAQTVDLFGVQLDDGPELGQPRPLAAADPILDHHQVARQV